MILSKQDLKYYLLRDKARNVGDCSFIKYYIKYLIGSEHAIAYHYLNILRHYEYSINCSKQSLCGKVIRFYWRFRLLRCSLKYNISIGPNMVGAGFRMPHIIGGGIMINCLQMGENCSANLNVLVGNKDSQENRPVMGDNVALATGCKVYGKITIGNNVTVAPNSVVFKDVPDNCVVSGIPAKIIKQK